MTLHLVKTTRQKPLSSICSSTWSFTVTSGDFLVLLMAACWQNWATSLGERLRTSPSHFRTGFPTMIVISFTFSLLRKGPHREMLY